MGLGLTEFLWAGWIAGTLPILIASLPSSRLSYFHEALMGFAKRGKTLQSPSSKFTVPQKFFCHFYLIAVVWTTLLLLSTWMYAYKSASGDQQFRVWRSVFLLLLMEVQVLRRIYETIYIFNYSPSAQMHVFGYLTGLFFYTAAPLSLCCNCIQEVYELAANGVVEFIAKGQIQMPAIEFNWWVFVSPLMKLGWLQLIGGALFFWGWIHQRCCHAILGSLRERGKQNEEYAIPHGDWFEMVSSPHYLAEIVIYAGLLVASGGQDLTIWFLFGFVVANLVLAAAETHRWYRSKFDNYPMNRLAILPFFY